MGLVEGNLTTYTSNNFDITLYRSLHEAKNGRFWHWKRTYIAKDYSDEKFYVFRLNLFERIYEFLGNKLAGPAGYSRIKNAYSLSFQAIDLLIYNTFKFAIQAGETAIIDEIDLQFQRESEAWLGNQDFNSNIPPYPDLQGQHKRDEWWGTFAHKINSQGLSFHLLRKVKTRGEEEDRPVALDIGCGKTTVPIDLLQKGWKVICLDYSKGALDALEERANAINEEWIKTQQLMLVHANIDDYEWPDNIDLIHAGSSLPYFNPANISRIMKAAYDSLRPGGQFVGNFFASKYYTDNRVKEFERCMGAWFMRDEDSVGHFLASQGYEIDECEHGGKINPYSVVFVAKKPMEEEQEKLS